MRELSSTLALETQKHTESSADDMILFAGKQNRANHFYWRRGLQRKGSRAITAQGQGRVGPYSEKTRLTVSCVVPLVNIDWMKRTSDATVLSSLALTVERV